MSLTSVQRSRKRFRRAGAAVALVTALGLLTAACTSSGDGDGGSGGSGDTGAGADASPGVTADTIKIGYQVVDLGDLERQLGFVNVDYGGPEGVTKQIEAVVNAVNANGGLNGRTIEPVIKIYVGAQDSPEYAESFCNSFTQDDQVFAVVLDGAFQNNARPCFAQRKTIIIDETLTAQDKAQFEKLAPFLWSPTFPEYGAFLNQELVSLQQSGWFNGNTGVAIVAVDSEVARTQVEQTVKPFLANNGGIANQTYFVDVSNTGSLGAGSASALAGAANAGLNRILIVGGARILPVMLSTPEAQAIAGRALFSVSSYDSPLFLQDNPTSLVTETLAGMTGFGFIPAGDIRDQPDLPFPDPTNPSQVLCKQIIDSAQATPPGGQRPNYKLGLQFCDGTFFLKAAVDKAPKDLTANAFRDAAWQIGTGYSSSVTFGGNLQSGDYWATSVGRVLAYDSETCQNPITNSQGCFLYRGGNVPFSTN